MCCVRTFQEAREALLRQRCEKQEKRNNTNLKVSYRKSNARKEKDVRQTKKKRRRHEEGEKKTAKQ